MEWNDDFDLKALELRELGCSQEEIASELRQLYGESFTRNSVKNRLFRLDARENYKTSEENRYLRTQNKNMGFVESIIQTVKNNVTAAEPIKVLPLTTNSQLPTSEVILDLSDLHFGFNSQAVVKRLNHLVETVTRITNIHRNGENISTLNIFMLGDIVDGYDIYPGQSAYLDHHIIGQVYKVGVPAVASAIQTLAQQFNKVVIHCVYGNHSRLNKNSPAEENLDIAFYHSLKFLLSGQKNVEVNVYNEEVKIVKIGKLKFCLTHLHGIQAYGDSPISSIIRKAYKWYATLGGFDYLMGGHFHHCSFVRASNFAIYLNGCFKAGDNYPLNKLGVETPPEQWFLGVSNKRITWQYAIDLT